MGAADAGLRAWAGSSQWVQRAGGNTHRGGFEVVKKCVNFMMEHCVSQELQQRFALSRLLFSSSSSSLTPSGHPNDCFLRRHASSSASWTSGLLDFWASGLPPATNDKKPPLLPQPLSMVHVPIRGLWQVAFICCRCKRCKRQSSQHV